MKIKLDLELEWEPDINGAWALIARHPLLEDELVIAITHCNWFTIYNERPKMGRVTCTSYLSGKRKILKYLRSKYQIVG